MLPTTVLVTGAAATIKNASGKFGPRSSLWFRYADHQIHNGYDRKIRKVAVYWQLGPRGLPRYGS